VSAVEEMINMITTQRNYELNSNDHRVSRRDAAELTPSLETS